MRGKVPRLLYFSSYGRITPAHAGKSRILTCNEAAEKDHPRACGEKFSGTRLCYRRVGSPPRMRGKAMFWSRNHSFQRITPAHAGKSRQNRAYLPTGQDHPRACGEKNTKQPMELVKGGSPPRMRGKAVHRDIFFCTLGITPAHAGKRADRFCCWSAAGDHPRACGEKSSVNNPTARPVGSPPRMRGKD